MIPTTSLFAPVDDDLRLLTDNLKNLVGARHPILAAAAEHLFEAGGKRVRPAIVLLVSRATMLDRDITPRHRRLAEITEMIHTASLVHDDVVDEAELRRSVPTVNSLFDNRVAVLAGDFLFAQSSWYLANLDNLEVVKLLSEVIRDFAEGEIQQGINRFDTSISLEAYLEKSYYKTASLIANSAKAAGVLSEQSAEVNHHLYNYGRNLGLAFQIVDDILDFTSPTEVLGKPSGSDLISGNITAPALFALEENSYIEVLLEREFSQEGDIEKALDLIHSSQGIPRSKELANQYGQSALKHLDCLASSPSKDVLIELVDYVLSRIY
ncbi:MAG: solanesyl diphosphate synthase [Microcystis aeruginosa Ma_MB_S_20031200_S102]|uniref:Solanesyl diphosphate synthase n=1 Tax=Microcystis aeruginosa Ma_MB_S_20031200_S102 TaxID=2486254 RepID=A0A552EXJ4_MICAE|nr:MAG: solanesyl diphosphate synthase [Microcystis aeruginosa Ma_MB_S_20031200_S102D]TRU39194.1 MAG: solanesyl diphosphate synthase [Microcystis aeruginosa Ma_MB_S_20031200_S102]